MYKIVIFLDSRFHLTNIIKYVTIYKEARLRAKKRKVIYTRKKGVPCFPGFCPAENLHILEKKMETTFRQPPHSVAFLPKSTHCVVSAVGKQKKICRILVKKVYSRCGYKTCSTDQFSRKSSVFFLELLGVIQATVSITMDSSIGLPADDIYKYQIDLIRAKGCTIAEVGKFATNDCAHANSFRGLYASIKQLMSKVLQYTLENNIGWLVITVHPKHVRFYTFLGFEQLSADIKTHRGVDAPAVLLGGDISKFKIQF